MSDMQAIDAYREWKEASAQWLRLANASDDWDGPDMSALSDREHVLEGQAVRETRRTEAEAALVAAVLWAFDGPGMADEAENREIVEREICMKMKLRLKEWAGTFLEPSPILTLFHRVMALIDAAECAVHEGTEDLTDEDMDRRFYDEISQLSEAIERVPAVTAADFAAKAIVATAKGGVCLDWKGDPLWIEARRLTGYED